MQRGYNNTHHDIKHAEDRDLFLCTSSSSQNLLFRCVKEVCKLIRGLKWIPQILLPKMDEKEEKSICTRYS